MIVFLTVSILVFVEVSLRVDGDLSEYLDEYMFQSLFSWKYLLELHHMRSNKQCHHVSILVFVEVSLRAAGWFRSKLEFIVSILVFVEVSLRVTLC